MGSVFGSQKETPANLKPSINLSDHFSIKRHLDESATEILLKQGYKENATMSFFKIAIGLIACSFALIAQFYPKKFPENMNILIACIILYALFNAGLNLVSHFVEKNYFLFTYPLPGSVMQTGLAVSSKLPKLSELYTITISSSDPKSKVAHSPAEFTKSVTEWFTADGVLAEDIFAKDVVELLQRHLNGDENAKKND